MALSLSNEKYQGQTPSPTGMPCHLTKRTYSRQTLIARSRRKAVGLLAVSPSRSGARYEVDRLGKYCRIWKGEGCIGRRSFREFGDRNGEGEGGRCAGSMLCARDSWHANTAREEVSLVGCVWFVSPVRMRCRFARVAGGGSRYVVRGKAQNKVQHRG